MSKKDKNKHSVVLLIKQKPKTIKESNQKVSLSAPTEFLYDSKPLELQAKSTRVPPPSKKHKSKELV